MKVVATLVGVEDLNAKLAGLLPKEAKNLCRRVIFDIAKDLRDDIKKEAPVGNDANPGTLRDAIIAKRERGTRESAEASVTIKRAKGESPTRYWHFWEFGTVDRAARPFIIPTTERMRDRLREIFETRFFSALAKLAAKGAK